MNFDDLLDDILDLPNPQDIIYQVQKTLDKEKKERLAFREWLTDDVKAEFINGEIVMHSPVKRGHLDACGNLFRMLSTYVIAHKLGKVSTEKALIALKRNDYEPDIAFWNNEQAKAFNNDTMIHPPPKLVVEVLSKSTQGRDRGVKYKDYAAHGIEEYWIINTKKQIIEQYILAHKNDKEYSLLSKLKKNETLESQAVKRFKIPVETVFSEEKSVAILSKLMKK